MEIFFFFFSVRRVTVSIRYLSSLFKLRGFLFSGVCLCLSETFQRHSFFFSTPLLRLSIFKFVHPSCVSGHHLRLSREIIGGSQRGPSGFRWKGLLYIRVFWRPLLALGSGRPARGARIIKRPAAQASAFSHNNCGP